MKTLTKLSLNKRFILLLMVSLALFGFGEKITKESPPEDQIAQKSIQSPVKLFSLTVEGMSCQMCVKAITSELRTLDAVSNITINIEKQNVSVEVVADNVTKEDLITIIENIGYSVKRNEK